MQDDIGDTYKKERFCLEQKSIYNWYSYISHTQNVRIIYLQQGM